MQRTILILTVVAVAAASAFADAAWASASGKPEHLSVVSTTSPSGVASVIATGAFTAGGTVLGSKTGVTVDLQHGTFEIQPQISQHVTVDKATCYFAATGWGTYTILHGTGAYKGIKGSGHLTFTEVSVVPKTSNGTCSANGPYQKIIELNGSVTLP